MAGGQYGNRGYLFQATVSVLESLLDNEWDYIELEPNTKKEKIDVYWRRQNTCVKAVQIKSSINNFEPSHINKWLYSMISDDKSANEYCLILIGPYTQNTKDYIEAINNRDAEKLISKLKPFGNRLNIKTIKYDHDEVLNAIELILQRYLEKIGYSLDTKILYLIMKFMVEDFIEYASFGRKLSRVKFNKIIMEYLQSFRLEDESKITEESISIYQKESELLNYKQKVAKNVHLAVKILCLVLGAFIINNCFKPLYMLALGLLQNSFFSIIIFALTISSIICLLKFSDRKFKQEFKEHYPDSEINFYKVRGAFGIVIQVIERNRFIGKYVEIHYIFQIQNNTNKTIETLTGTAHLSTKSEILRPKSFFVEEIFHGTTVTVFDKIIYINTNDYFFIDDRYRFRIEFTTKEQEKVYSSEEIIRKPIRTHFLILNRFNYIPYLKRILPYEISWIKDEVIPFIKAWFKFQPNIFYRLQRYIIFTVMISVICCSAYGFTNIIKSLINYIFE